MKRALRCSVQLLAAGALACGGRSVDPGLDDGCSIGASCPAGRDADGEVEENAPARPADNAGNSASDSADHSAGGSATHTASSGAGGAESGMANGIASESTGVGGGPGGFGSSSFWAGGTPPAECALPSPRLALDFIVMEFANHTSAPLYLASRNEDCGLWPAYVEFQRGGEVVDLYDGDCAADCTQVTDSGYESHGSLPPDCATYPACNTPLRLVPPGESIYQFVYPEAGIPHDVPGSCFPDGSASSCQTNEILPSGQYTLLAYAYPALSCGEASCPCNPEGGDICTGLAGVEPARGTGEVHTVGVSFDYNPAQLGPHASFEFVE